MSNVKWIKITTNMFDDEKIRLIESMPDRDAILIIWIKLLTQAGRCNASGCLVLSEKIPYTDEMLSTIFNRPLSTIRMALKIFEDFGMIEKTDNFKISNWEKHQNVEGLEKIREQNRERKRRQREKEKELQLQLKSRDTSREVTQQNKNKNKNKNNNILSEICSDIVNFLNDKTNKSFKNNTKKTVTLINARLKEGFTVNDFKKVISTKVDEWKNDEKMSSYLRPETLFGNKFESYLNQKNEKKEVSLSEQIRSRYKFYDD